MDTSTEGFNIFTGKASTDHELIVYVPSTQGLKGEITRAKHEARTHYIAGYFSALFGGATIKEGQGYYKADNGEEVREGVNLVCTACNLADLEGQKGTEVSQLVQDKRADWGQESIMVEVKAQSRTWFV